MFTTVNPMQVKPGDNVRVRSGSTKTRKVRNVDFCPGNPECVHLDHECYDSRFATVDISDRTSA